MRLEFTLAGVTALIMHCGATGLDTRSALSREIAAITAKRGGNRTAVDDKRLWELECRRSLYLDAGGRPTLPEAALRRMIENGARKTKQGSLVREGLMIESVTFRYDVDRYGETVEKLITTTQFVVPVVVTKRILRSRAKFDCPWSVVGVADVDPETGRHRPADRVVGHGRPPRRARRLAAGKERPLREVQRREGARAGGRSLRAASASLRVARHGVAWRAGAWHG